MARSRLNPIGQVENFQDRFGSLGGAIIAGVGGIIVTVLTGIALIVDAGRRVITEPLEALIGGVGGIFNAMVGGAADIIRQGAETTINSIAPGAQWAVGPLTFALSIGVIGLGMYVFAQIMEMEATSNILPFTQTDLPIIGAEEEDEGG